MLSSKFRTIVFLNLLMSLQFVVNENNCEEKEKALINLDVAEYLITNTKQILPNCTGVATDISDCGIKEKVAAHLDMVQKLICEAKENYPTCIGNKTKDPEIKDPITEEPDTEEPDQSLKSRDCFEVFQNGQNMTGVYTIWPSSPLFPNKSLKVFCDMDTDGGGWTVVQRRGDFRPQEDFNRDWNDYKLGFGNITKDFWLGNDNLFILSNERSYMIRFDLKNVEGENAYALYFTFHIDNEQGRYKLHIGNFTGNAGDSMERNNEQIFSTNDRDNPEGCVKRNGGGWWYSDCGFSQMNSNFSPGSRGGPYNYVAWYLWKKEWVGLAATEIKIKPIENKSYVYDE